MMKPKTTVTAKKTIFKKNYVLKHNSVLCGHIALKVVFWILHPKINKKNILW